MPTHCLRRSEEMRKGHRSHFAQDNLTFHLVNLAHLAFPLFTAVRLHVYLVFVKSIEQELKIHLTKRPYLGNEK